LGLTLFGKWLNFSCYSEIWFSISLILSAYNRKSRAILPDAEIENVLQNGHGPKEERRVYRGASFYYTYTVSVFSDFGFFGTYFSTGR
jgi:hypothetical protein